MNRKTLTALKKSIAHWEEMARTGWEKEQPLPEQCALCGLFSRAENLEIQPGQSCLNCPVYQSGNGRYSCENTPYEEADEWLWINKSKFKAAARKEVKFLRSLLPKPAKKTKAKASV